MNYLNKISSNAMQTFNLTGIPGQSIVLNLRFLPGQALWTMDLQVNKTQNINGLAILRSPNLLRAFKNVISFGLTCTTSDGLDPHYIDDFSTGRASLYLLNAADVAKIEAGLFL